MTESPDRLTELLRSVAPPARYDVERVRDRIERSARRHSWKRGAFLWGIRAAAAGAFFLLGTYYTQLVATDIGLRQLGRLGQLGSIEGVRSAEPTPLLAGAAVPLSIQRNGSGYVASLAALTELQATMTAEEREVARQVAISVLAGAIAELALAGDGRLPPEIMRAVEAHGAPLTAGNSVRTP